MAAKKKTVKKVAPKPKAEVSKDTVALEWLIASLKWRHMASDLLKEVAEMRK